MFEINAREKVNERLRALFPAIGYRLFRQLGGAPILVPHDAPQPLDEYELNLFAAKPGRVTALSQQGLLTDVIPAWAPGPANYKIADAFWQGRNFMPSINLSDGIGLHAESEYREGLVAYATWRAADQEVAIRCAALAFALSRLRVACAGAPTAGRLSSLARVAWEWGARSESVSVLKRLLNSVQSGQIYLVEPFLPAHPRFENVAAGSQPANWFIAAAAEQFERTSGFSSMFTGASPFLTWLCAQPLASTEMERRRVLVAARAGQRPIVPARLCQDKPDHLNAKVWRWGDIPGTLRLYQP